MPDANQFVEDLVRGLPAATNAPAAGPGPAPAMQRSQFEIAREERGQQEIPFAIRNRKDVPIDTSESPGAWVKFQVARRRDPIDKVQFLEEQFGKGMVRLADDGTPLIKVPTVNGAREIPVDEQGLTWSDLATIGGHGPEILGGIIGPILARKGPGGKATGVGGLARDVITSAVGAETGGLAQDIAVSQAPATELALQRAKMLPLDIGAGTVLGGAAMAVGKAISPFAQPASEQVTRMRQGLATLDDLVGEKFPLSVGQATGSPLLQRVEARMEKIPGATGRFQSIDEAQESWFKKLQNRMLGLPAEAGPTERTAMLSEEGQIGSAAIGRLAQAVDEQKGAISGAQANAQRAISNEVMDELAQASSVNREISPLVAGDAIRKRVIGLKEEFDTRMDQVFTDLDAMLGGKDRIFRLPNLAAAAKAKLDALPHSGGEVSSTVPASVRKPLEELTRAGDEYKSLSDLRRLRTNVRNDIKASEAIPGTDTHDLGEIVDMIGDALDEAASKTPTAKDLGKAAAGLAGKGKSATGQDIRSYSRIAETLSGEMPFVPGQLKEAMDKATKEYREGITPFKEKYVARLFHNIEKPSFIAEEDIVKNIKVAEYESYKRVLGEGSPEFAQLKRSIMDQVLRDSTQNGLISGKAFNTQLDALWSSKPEIFKEVFGGNAANLRRLTIMLDDAGAKLNPDALQTALAEPGAISKPEIRSTIGKLLEEQTKLDRTYRSKILKDIGEGRLSDNFGDTAQFVNRFMSTASPSEAASVMSILSDRPELQADIKRKMIQNIFFEAQAAAKPREIATLGPGEASRMASERKLHEIFGDDQRKKVLQTLLGEDTYNNFRALADVLASTQRSERAFASSGGIAAGVFVGNMLRDPLSYASDWVKQKVASIIITMPLLRSWARGTTMTPERIGSLTRSVLASREFLEAAANEFGQDQLPMVITTLKQSVNRFEQAGPKKTEGQPQTAMEFINQMQRQNTNAPPPPRIMRTQ